MIATPDKSHRALASSGRCVVICIWQGTLRPGTHSDIFAGSPGVFARGGHEVSDGHTITRSTGPLDPQGTDSSLSSSRPQRPSGIRFPFHIHSASGPTHRPGASTERTRPASGAPSGRPGYSMGRCAVAAHARASIEGSARRREATVRFELIRRTHLGGLQTVCR
jgi:hypothetical protein